MQHRHRVGQRPRSSAGTAWNSSSRLWPTTTLTTDTAMYLAPFSLTEAKAPETNEGEGMAATYCRHLPRQPPPPAHAHAHAHAHRSEPSPGDLYSA